MKLDQKKNTKSARVKFENTSEIEKEDEIWEGEIGCKDRLQPWTMKVWEIIYFYKYKIETIRTQLQNHTNLVIKYFIKN